MKPINYSQGYTDHELIAKEIKISNQLSGIVTDNKIQEILNASESKEYKELLNKGFSVTLLSDFQKSFEGLDTKKISSILDTINVPKAKLVFGYYASWNKLLNALTIVFLVAYIALTYFISQVFADDKSKKTDQLLLTTAFGRTKLTITKLLNSFLFTTGLYVIIVMISLLIFSVMYGFSGINTSLQLNLALPHIMEFPNLLSMGQFLLIYLTYHYLAFLFISSITVVLSSLANNSFIAFSEIIAILFIPALIENFADGSAFENVFLFSPIVNCFANNILINFTSSNAMFNDFWQNYLSVVIIMLIIFGIANLFIYGYWKKEKQN